MRHRTWPSFAKMSSYRWVGLLSVILFLLLLNVTVDGKGGKGRKFFHPISDDQYEMLLQILNGRKVTKNASREEKAAYMKIYRARDSYRVIGELLYNTFDLNLISSCIREGS